MYKFNEHQLKWLEALESGEYEQTTGTLFIANDDHPNGAYCCLGVGAKVMIKGSIGIYVILKIDEDKGCFFGCGLWKCRTELEPYNVTESEQAPEGATAGEPALIGWQDPNIVDLEITLTKELFISLAMDAHLCNISLNEHLVNIIKGEYK